MVPEPVWLRSLPITPPLRLSGLRPRFWSPGVTAALAARPTPVVAVCAAAAPAKAAAAAAMINFERTCMVDSRRIEGKSIVAIRVPTTLVVVARPT